MLDYPLEFALVEFKGNKFSGKIVPELLDLADRGIVHFVDIVFIRKDKDGSTRTVELNDLDEAAYRMFVPLGKRVESIFTDDDVEYAASRLPKNSSAALFLWENLWMDNIRKAVKDSGGKVVDRFQIAPEVVAQFKKGLEAEKRKAAKKKAAAPKKAAPKKAATKKK